MSVRPSANFMPSQDMPPAGGYRKLDMTRYLSKTGIDRGPKGWQLWAGSAVIIAYGYYKVGQYNIERNQQKMQERKVRYALAPVLQAEADREYMVRETANLKKEAEVMKDVAGWQVGMSPYFSGKWMPRAIAQLDRSTK